MTGDADVFLADRQLRTAGDLDHLLHEIDAGDHFGDGVFDLDAGVDLDEIEFAAHLVVEIFDRAGAPVVDLAREGDRAGAERLAHVVRQAEGGSFFPDLLVAALQRALALEAMDGILAVAEDLHLDVTGAGNHLLDIEAAVAEGGERLGRGLREMPLEIRHVFRDADTAATTTGGRLNHHREADLFYDGASRLEIVDAPLGTRYGRNAGALGDLAGLDLVSEKADGTGLRADEDQTCIFHGLGEGGIFGEETVTRMDRVDACFLRRLQDGFDVEVGLGRGRRPDLDRLVGELDGEHVAVGGGMDLHGPYAERLGGADDPHRDLAPIGNEDRADGHASTSATA